MPKMKTHKGTKKRFSVTAKGKFKRRQAFNNHLFTPKSSNRKRRLSKPTLAHPADAKRLKRLLPYG
jgi:large subunit ribosomal protein L35